jgi:hypothetical protein
MGNTTTGFDFRNILQLVAQPNAAVDTLFSNEAIIQARNLDLNQKNIRRDFLKLILILSEKKPIPFATIIKLLSLTSANLTLKQALMAHNDKEGLKTLLLTLKKLLSEAQNGDHIQNLYLLVTGQELHKQEVPTDSSMNETLPVYQNNNPSIYTQALGDKNIILLMEESISIALEKGLDNQLVFNLFTSSYALLKRVNTSLVDKTEIIKIFIRQANILNILFEKGLITETLFKEKQIFNFIVKLIENTGLTGNGNEFVIQKLIAHLFSLLSEEDMRLFFNEIFASKLSSENKSHLVLMVLKTNLISDSLGEVFIQNTPSFSLSYLLSKGYSKKDKSANLIKAIFAKKSLEISLSLEDLSFHTISSLIERLGNLKEKCTPVNIFFILKNIDLAAIHYILKAYSDDSRWLRFDPAQKPLELLQTLDQGNIHPAEIMQLMLVPDIYSSSENHMIPFVNCFTKTTLEKYASLILNVWDKYNAFGVSLISGAKRPQISELTSLFSAQYSYRKDYSNANLLQHIIRNKDEKSFELFLRASFKYISETSPGNKGDVDGLFDLFTASKFYNLNRNFAKYQVNALNSPYVLASSDSYFSDEMMRLLKLMLTKELIEEPGKKVLKLLRGLTEHITSIRNPKDKSLLRLVQNNFSLLEICLQKRSVTVTDCLEIIFAPSKNKNYSTILDFSAANNLEVLAKIFDNLHTMRQYGSFNIDPYIEQAMASPNLNSKQKAYLQQLHTDFSSGKFTEQLATKLSPTSSLNPSQKTQLVLNLIQSSQLGAEHEAVISQFHDQINKEALFAQMHSIPQSQHTPEYKQTLSMLIRALQPDNPYHWNGATRNPQTADASFSDTAGLAPASTSLPPSPNVSLTPQDIGSSSKPS